MNRCLEILQNEDRLSDDFNVVGRSFQMPGAATEKALLLRIIYFWEQKANTR